MLDEIWYNVVGAGLVVWALAKKGIHYKRMKGVK